MRKLLKKPLLLAIIGLILFFTVHKIYMLHKFSIKTETAFIGSISNSLQGKGFIVREETEIFNKIGGVINFLLNDGDKVSKGGVIAKIYSSESDNLLQKEAERLNKEIFVLESLERDKNKISTNLTYLEKRIYQNLKKLLLCINKNSYSELAKNREQILYLLSERQAVIDKTYDFSESILDLKKQRDVIDANCAKKLGTILASDSGYFVGNVDGFENIVDYKSALNVNSEQITQALKSSEQKSDAVAKIVNTSYWYLICDVEKDKLKSLSVGDEVSLSLPFANIEKIPVKIAALDKGNACSEIPLVLKCNYVNKDILNLRKEEFKIDFSEHSGIKIKKSAIHEKMMTKMEKNEDGTEVKVEKKVQGVYIIKNKQLSFKEVLIIYADENYVVCKENPDDSEVFSNDYINLYDEVVVDGSDLYDGKFLK